MCLCRHMRDSFGSAPASAHFCTDLQSPVPRPLCGFSDKICCYAAGVRSRHRREGIFDRLRPFRYGASSNAEPTFAAPRRKVVPYSKPLLNTTIELCGLFGQLNSTVSVQALPPDGGASLKMVPQPV